MEVSVEKGPSQLPFPLWALEPCCMEPMVSLFPALLIQGRVSLD